MESTKDNQNYPTIGAFDNDQPLTLRPFENGGWTICQTSLAPGETGKELGAYSNAADMLAALSRALT